MTYETGLSMEERVTSLFQPDTLMPDQYLDTFRRKSPLEPEKKLLLAVLEDGIASFQKHAFARDGKGRNLFRETEDWILRDDSEWLFSFNSICEILGLDPGYLRQGLMRWKESRLENQGKAKVYRLTPRKGNRRAGATSTRRTQRVKKAASR